jgi:hypothetical protein
MHRVRAGHERPRRVMQWLHGTSQAPFRSPVLLSLYSQILGFLVFLSILMTPMEPKYSATSAGKTQESSLQGLKPCNCRLVHFGTRPPQATPCVFERPEPSALERRPQAANTRQI